MWCLTHEKESSKRKTILLRPKKLELKIKRKPQIHRALKAYKKEKKIKSVLIGLKVIPCLGLPSDQSRPGSLARLRSAPSRDSGLSEQQWEPGIVPHPPRPGLLLPCACPAALPTALLRAPAHREMLSPAWEQGPAEEPGRSVLPQQPLADRALPAPAGGIATSPRWQHRLSAKGQGASVPLGYHHPGEAAVRLSLDML